MNSVIAVILFTLTIGSQASLAAPDYHALEAKTEACAVKALTGNAEYAAFLNWQVKYVLADGSGLELPAAPQGVDPQDLTGALKKLAPNAARAVADCLELSYPYREVYLEKLYVLDPYRGGYDSVFYTAFVNYLNVLRQRSSAAHDSLNAQYVRVVTETEFMQKMQDGKIKSINDEAAKPTIDRAVNEILVPLLKDQLLVELMSMTFIDGVTKWRGLL